MISVFHVISGDLWAGAEVMVYSLLEGLKKYEDIQLSAILLNEGKLAENLRKLNIPVDVIDENKISTIGIMKNMRSIIKNKNCIIHSHRHKENILAFISSRKNMGKNRLISTQHGIPEFYDYNKNIRHKLLHELNFFILSKYFRKIITVSDDINKILNETYNFSKYKLRTIYNGVNTDVNCSKKQNDGLFVVGLTGRLFPVKNIQLMVEIAREIRRITDNIRFEIAGDGPERGNISTLIRRYDLEKTVQLLGFMDDLSGFYNRIDLYLNTSFHEGLPMGALEAMSYGVPIIAPNVGGFKEIMQNGVHGYIIDGREPKVYAERILDIYNNNELRNNMAIASRDTVVNKFTMDRMSKEYYNLYLETAEN